MFYKDTLVHCSVLKYSGAAPCLFYSLVPLVVVVVHRVVVGGLSSVTSHPVKNNNKKKVVGSGVGLKLLVLEGTNTMLLHAYMDEAL